MVIDKFVDRMDEPLTKEDQQFFFNMAITKAIIIGVATVPVIISAYKTPVTLEEYQGPRSCLSIGFLFYLLMVICSLLFYLPESLCKSRPSRVCAFCIWFVGLCALTTLSYLNFVGVANVIMGIMILLVMIGGALFAIAALCSVGYR